MEEISTCQGELNRERQLNQSFRIDSINAQRTHTKVNFNEWDPNIEQTGTFNVQPQAYNNVETRANIRPPVEYKQPDEVCITEFMKIDAYKDAACSHSITTNEVVCFVGRE